MLLKHQAISSYSAEYAEYASMHFQLFMGYVCQGLLLTNLLCNQLIE